MTLISVFVEQKQIETKSFIGITLAIWYAFNYAGLLIDIKVLLQNNLWCVVFLKKFFLQKIV